jgi:2-keto-3-deoxy-L-rhamnonate aldolase RhmA
MSLRSAELKRRIVAHEAVIGAWLTLSGLNVAEIMAGAGFDWLMIDTEHSVFDLSELQVTLSAFRGVSTVPFVRVAANDPARIKHALDVGAEGIVIPNIDNAEQAQRAVGACKYPPAGYRGYGPRRASDYYRDIDRYIETANRDLFVILQIESAQGVEQIDAILEVPGIDIIFLGPQDLSGSFGLLRQTNHSNVIDALTKVKTACRGRNMAVCSGAFDASLAPKLIEEGVRVLLSSFDDALLRNAAEATVAKLRAEIG